MTAALREACVRGEALLEPEVTDREIAAYGNLAAPSAGFHVAVTVLAVPLPVAAAFGFLAIAVLINFPVRGDIAQDGMTSLRDGSAGG
jgi:hypothetical protein